MHGDWGSLSAYSRTLCGGGEIIIKKNKLKCEDCYYAVCSDVYTGKCPKCGGVTVPDIEKDVASNVQVEDCKEKMINSNSAENLMTCKSCHHKFSKRAKACPKCGCKPKLMCQICHKEIPSDSTICPECGDPEPFTGANFQRDEEISDFAKGDNAVGQKIATKKSYPWKTLLIWLPIIFIMGLISAKPEYSLPASHNIGEKTAIVLKVVIALTYTVIGAVVIWIFKYFRR
ncbi:MAG: hypothetical protein U5J62_01250 [Desulfurivibrio sp.]|nr:hypothetical protein [Desulfurivibrio sp.]